MGARKRPVEEPPPVDHTEADMRLGTALNAAILSKIGPAPGPKTPKGCRWIEGDVSKGGDWRYCQKPPIPGSVLCRQHHGRAWTNPRKRTKDQ